MSKKKKVKKKRHLVLSLVTPQLNFQSRFCTSSCFFFANFCLTDYVFLLRKSLSVQCVFVCVCMCVTAGSFSVGITLSYFNNSSVLWIVVE